MQRIIDILALSADYLKAKGIPQPRRNAELLLCDVLGKSRLELYLEHDRPVTEEQLSALRELMRARAAHKPLQYVLGKTEFFSLPFQIPEGVFIPRPETELLVEEVIRHIRSLPESQEIIVYDVGTGSGCIAVSVASNVPNCRVYASDISAKAIAVAKDNAERNGVGERVVLLHGDLFAPYIEHGAPKADVIASNPPYIAEEDWESLPEEVRRFEPRESLLAGRKGLDCLVRIIASATSSLRPGGKIFLEIGHGQKEAVMAFLQNAYKYIDMASRKDYNNIERVVIATFAASGEERVAKEKRDR